MDGRRFPLDDPRGSPGTDAVPITAGSAVTACDSIERPAVAVGRESSQIVYCGTDQQVGEGFAIALRIMGVDASFLPAGALATNIPNTEDN